MDDYIHQANPTDMQNQMNFSGIYPHYNPEAYDLFNSLTEEARAHNNNVPAKADPPNPAPIVICPTEVDHINVTLEKNQQCACKDCGKLYLKQHAVKHSNDRPFKCKFCFKTYKFRSNLYQHKCPDRQKSGQTGRRMIRNAANPMMPSASAKKTENPAKPVSDDFFANLPQAGTSTSGQENEENDAPTQIGMSIRIEQADNWQPRPPPQITVEPAPPKDCIREQQLPQEEIDQYVAQNKHKLFNCRKCKLLFPSEASLQRHNSVHVFEETYCYSCPNCREAFTNEKDLKSHAYYHAANSPFKCDSCSGCFRSNVALKRHQCASLECTFYPFGVEPELLPSPPFPIDPWAFIISPADELLQPSTEDLDQGRGPDSGLGSDASPRSHASPELPVLPGDVDLDEILFGKKRVKREKDDDEDSGFRSRLNSMAQSSCSPHSLSDASGSPQRKMSSSGNAGEPLTDLGFSDLGTGYGQGPAYGTMLSRQFEQSVGGNSSFASLDMAFSLEANGPSVESFGTEGPLALQLAPVFNVAPRITKGTKTSPVSSRVAATLYQTAFAPTPTSTFSESGSARDFIDDEQFGTFYEPQHSDDARSHFGHRI